MKETIFKESISSRTSCNTWPSQTTRAEQTCAELQRFPQLKRTDIHLISRLPPHFRDSVFLELLGTSRDRKGSDTRSQSCGECARRFNQRYERTVSLNRIQLTRRSGAFTASLECGDQTGQVSWRSARGSPNAPTCMSWTLLGRAEKQARNTQLYQTQDMASIFPKIRMSPDVTKITPQRRDARKVTVSPSEIGIAPPPTPIRPGNCSPARTWTYLIGVR